MKLKVLVSSLDAKTIETFQSNVIWWFTNNGRTFPWRQTQDPFRILVAEVVLKLTGASKAKPAYEYLVNKFDTPDRLTKANPEELAKVFRPLGLHSRANLLADIAKQLNDQFGGQVPRTYAELVSLKGIGQYTANAILCLSYGERVPLVDGNVSRIFHRCFKYPVNEEAQGDKKLWRMASDFLPQKAWREYNLGLLDLGALVCKHAKPRCNMCPVIAICARHGISFERINLEVSKGVES